MWKAFIGSLDPNCTFSEPVTLQAISEAEVTLAIKFPQVLSSLLLETNGVIDSTYSHLIWNIETIQKYNHDLRTDAEYAKLYMSFDCLFFFADAGNGDLFAFPIIQGNIQSDKVFVWNHIDDSRTWIASSLEKYLDWWINGLIKI